MRKYGSGGKRKDYCLFIFHDLGATVRDGGIVRVICHCVLSLQFVLLIIYPLVLVSLFSFLLLVVAVLFLSFLSKAT